jgi:hypothetical protein
MDRFGMRWPAGGAADFPGVEVEMIIGAGLAILGSLMPAPAFGADGERRRHDGILEGVFVRYGVGVGVGGQQHPAIVTREVDDFGAGRDGECQRQREGGSVNFHRASL